MEGDLSGWYGSSLGVIASFLTAILGPILTTAFQNHRTHRLRTSIADNAKLHTSIIESGLPVSAEVKRDLEDLMNAQAISLIGREQAWLNRRREWSNLGLSIFLLFIGGPALWWMRVIDTWWSWLVFAVIATILAVFSAVGIYLTFWPGDEKPPMASDQKAH